MNRREFVVATGAAGSTALAGCSGESNEDGPIPVVSNAERTDPRNIETTNDGNEFTITIQNVGAAGTVIVKLYFTEDGEPSPSPVAETNTYIESGDSRTISFERDPPEWATGYEFQYSGTAYTAEIRNDGVAGDFEVELIDRPSGSVIENKTITMNAGETRTVVFETTHEFEDEYEIEARAI